MTESDLYRQIPLALSNNDSRLWRANAGMAWSGTVIERTPRYIMLADPRPVRLGPEGFSDLFGLKRITITPEMVGRSVALFAGIECKSERGRLSESQSLFLDMLRSMRALHGVARSVEDARKILTVTDQYP